MTKKTVFSIGFFLYGFVLSVQAITVSITSVPSLNGYVSGNIPVYGTVTSNSPLTSWSLSLNQGINSTLLVSNNTSTENGILTNNWNTTLTDDGVYTLSLYALDNTNAVCTASMTITVNNRLPTVSITNVPSSNGLINGTITITGLVTSNLGLLKSWSLVLYQSNVLKSTLASGTLAVENSSLKPNWNTSEQNNGFYTLRLMAMNMAGGISTNSMDITISNNLSNSSSTLSIEVSALPAESLTMIEQNTVYNIPLLKINLSATGKAVSIRSIIITHNGTLPFATQVQQTFGITKVYLYQDNGDGLYNNTDTVLKEIDLSGLSPASNSQSLIIDNFTLSIPVNDPKTVFFVYEIHGVTQNLGKTMKIGIISTRNISHDGNQTVFQSTSMEATRLISGGYINRAESLAPSYIALDNDYTQAMIGLTLNLIGELIQTIKIAIGSEISFNTSLLKAVSLYLDHPTAGTPGVFDSADILQSNAITTFPASQHEVIFSWSPFWTSGAYHFFVVYTTNHTAPDGSLLKAKINSIQIKGQSTQTTLNVMGDFPSPVTSAVTQLISNFTLTINHLSAFPTQTVYQGSQKVPMLKFTLKKLSAHLGPIKLTIRNNGDCPFYNLASGVVNTLWLYEDNPVAGITGQFDGRDLLNQSVTTIDANGKDMHFLNITLDQDQEKTYFVLYDVGMLGTGTALAKVHAIDGTSLYIDHVSLNVTATCSVVACPVVVDSITSNIVLIDSRTTEPILVTISVRNTTDSPIFLSKLMPAFYQNSISGKELSAEYILSSLFNTGVTLNPGTHTFVFSISTKKMATRGLVIVDAYIQLDSNNIRTQWTRYPISNTQYHALSNTLLIWNMNLFQTPSTWTYPAHVVSVNLRQGSVLTSFENGDPVIKGALVDILFNQRVVDMSSIKVAFNQTTCSLVAGTPATIYQYAIDSLSGILTTQVPTTSGHLIVSARDWGGFSLASLDLFFPVYAFARIDNVLIYPNPFPVDGTTPLIIAFNIGQEAWVDFSLVSSTGQLIWESRGNHFPYPGYNEYKLWTGQLNAGHYISSGIYVLRITAKDENGKQSFAHAKLAIR